MIEYKEFAEGLWFSIEGDIVSVGVTAEALNHIEMIQNYHISEEGDNVEADQIVGEILSESESINIYSPVSGEVIEVNEAIIENPSLVYEDPTGDSWLFKIRAEDEEEIESLSEEEELIVAT